MRSSPRWQVRGCLTNLRILPLRKFSRVCWLILSPMGMLWTLSPLRPVGRRRGRLKQRTGQGLWWRLGRRQIWRESFWGSTRIRRRRRRDAPSYCSPATIVPIQSPTLQIFFQTPLAVVTIPKPSSLKHYDSFKIRKPLVNCNDHPFFQGLPEISQEQNYFTTKSSLQKARSFGNVLLTGLD